MYYDRDNKPFIGVDR